MGRDNGGGTIADMMEEVVGSFLDMVAIQTQNINLKLQYFNYNKNNLNY